jgi:hypothetical protein
MSSVTLPRLFVCATAAFDSGVPGAPAVRALGWLEVG